MSKCNVSCLQDIKKKYEEKSFPSVLAEEYARRSLVSVIIPVRRGEKIAYDPSLNTYKNTELIIVDENTERSQQRNIGFERSKGYYILYLDSDMAVHKRLIEECIEKFFLYDLLYIPEVIIGNKIRNFERSFYNETCIDAVRFIKREKFVPFDEKLTAGEDWDWDRRLKGKRGCSYFPLYHHDQNVLTKKAGYCFHIRYYISKWNNDFIVKKQTGFWYRYVQVFIENGKWKKIIVYPVLFVKMYWYRIKLGFVYLRNK